MKTTGYYSIEGTSLILGFQGIFNEKSILEAEKFMKSDLIPSVQRDACNWVVFDLERCTDYEHSFMRAAVKMNSVLKKENKSLGISNASKNLCQVIYEAGLSSVLKMVTRGGQAPVEGAMSTPKMDVTFLNPFIDGAMETLKIQCSTEATPGVPFLKTKQFHDDVDIAGVIGLKSPSFRGSIALCFPEKTFLEMMSAMLGEEFRVISKDLEDGAGELLNIIFGQAKKKLMEKNYRVDQAIPTIVKRLDEKIGQLTPEPTVVIPFQTPRGAFHIQIGLE